jgi:short-subunit dehydrogenase
VLCPATTRTEFHGLMGMDLSKAPITVMSAEDVVQASLAGLRLGEVVCIPGLDDPAALEGLHSAQTQLLQHSRGNVLADRYAAAIA